MTRRQTFYTLVVLVGCMFAAYQYGQLVGRAEGRAIAKAVLEEMAQEEQPMTTPTGPPNEFGSHRWTGSFTGNIGGLEFHFMRYSRLDASHDKREWDSMACVPAGRGLEIGGRWDPDGWWVEAHDYDHPYPDSIRIPVKDIAFSPLNAK